eukprot:Rhum_TRINITY_DN16478_c0_g1::Rhum_TRINITY_DN16478_c0_g1_i1::g.163300::m.163300
MAAHPESNPDDCAKHSAFGAAAAPKAGEVTKGTEENVIERPALGRTVLLGQLWDAARYDGLPGASLWDLDVVKEKATQTKTESVSFTLETSTEERMRSHFLDSEAMLSVKAGLFEVGGTSGSLFDEVTGSNEFLLTVTCKRTSHVMQMNPWLDLGTRSYHAPKNAVMCPTHFVSEITYGGVAVFEFKFKADSTEEKESMITTFKASFTSGPAGHNAGAEATHSNGETKTLNSYASKLSINFHCDFTPESKEGAWTVAEALSEARALPARLKDAARPLSFKCHPINERVVNNFADMFKFKSYPLSATFMQFTDSILNQMDTCIAELTVCTSVPNALLQAYTTHGVMRQNVLAEWLRLITWQKHKLLRNLRESIPYLKTETNMKKRYEDQELCLRPKQYVELCKQFLVDLRYLDTVMRTLWIAGFENMPRGVPWPEEGTECFAVNVWGTYGVLSPDEYYTKHHFCAENPEFMKINAHISAKKACERSVTEEDHTKFVQMHREAHSSAKYMQNANVPPGGSGCAKVKVLEKLFMCAVHRMRRNNASGVKAKYYILSLEHELALMRNASHGWVEWKEPLRTKLVRGLTLAPGSFFTGKITVLLSGIRVDDNVRALCICATRFEGPNEAVKRQERLADLHGRLAENERHIYVKWADARIGEAEKNAHSKEVMSRAVLYCKQASSVFNRRYMHSSRAQCALPLWPHNPSEYEINMTVGTLRPWSNYAVEVFAISADGAARIAMADFCTKLCGSVCGEAAFEMSVTGDAVPQVTSASENHAPADVAAADDVNTNINTSFSGNP